MYSRGTLKTLIDSYLKDCDNQPTKKGLSEKLGISPTTIYNVCLGTFNGHIYTATPHVKRAIDNKDFELITGLFEKGVNS